MKQTVLSGDTFSGVSVRYVKARRVVELFGWHGAYGIEPRSLSLQAFLDQLGVSDGDLRRVIKERASAAR